MSWKLFGQIVLLIIIAAVVAAVTKASIYRVGCYRGAGMHHKKGSMLQKHMSVDKVTY